MFNYSSFRRLKSFYSYDEVLEHYNSVEPIQGNGANRGRRPIGERRYVDKFHMVATVYEGKRSIDMYLYSSPVIRFIQGGGIILNTRHSHADADEREFINALVRGYEVIYRGKEFLLVHIGTGITQALDFITPVTLTPDELGRLKVTAGGKTLRRHKLMRKKFNVFVSACKPFIKHVENLARIHDPEEVYNKPHPFTGGLHEAIASVTPDMATWDNALIMQLILHSVDRNFAWSGTGYIHHYTMHPERVGRMVREGLKYSYAPEIFEVEEVHPADWKGDSNAKYTYDIRHL